MEWKPNEHGRLFIRGVADDQDQANAVLKASAEDRIEVFASQESGEGKIFSGLISAVQTKHHNGVYVVEVEGVSGTSQLDVQKRRRSFQDSRMTYGELVRNVLKGYAGSDVIQLIGDKEPIGAPIVQYDETDWEFLKRMASHFETVLFSDISEAKPRLYIGVPSRNSFRLPDDLPYTASKDLLAYQEAMAAGSSPLHSTDFFTYEVRTGERYSIGDEVLFREKPLVISEIKAGMDQGQLVYTYRLSRSEGIRQNRIWNRQLVGVSLNGKVLDVKGQQVKLHLEIDKEQPPAAAYWFPFAPPTGNVMYSMPQKGTTASLYFPDDAGSKAKVTGCVRTNGEDCSKTGNPQNRYFGTEHGSELEMTPTAINIVSGSKEPLKISFDDAAGVTLTSHRKLMMNAGEEISLYTPKRVVFRTTNMILAKKLSKQSGFTLESEYHVLGSQVKLVGADRTSYAKYDDDIQTYTPQKEEKKGWGLFDTVLAAVAVVVVVALVVAATVVTGGVAGAILMGAACGAVAAVGATAIGDLARGELSSGATYLRSAVTGGIVGAVTGGIFGPLAGAASTSLAPLTTSQLTRGLTTYVATNFAAGYTDYTLFESINGRRPKFTEALASGLLAATVSSVFLAAIKPLRTAVFGLFRKGTKVDPLRLKEQPHVDELEINRQPEVEEPPNRGAEDTGNPLKKYSVEDFTEEMAKLPHAKISTEMKGEIIGIPKGQKPDPSVYMSSSEIKRHLSLFDDGAVRIQSKESFEKAIQLYGSNIGDPETGTFVLPKSVVNKAVEASNGNPRILEDLLGLDPGYLGEHPIILEINNPSNIRIPSGNEAGAWPKYWIPGGYTSGGVPEAVVDQIQSGGYTISDVYPKQ
ncbi:contractile injection system protein, VgrG/Pvc8 family [Paenibacillus sp. TH7-28]